MTTTSAPMTTSTWPYQHYAICNTINDHAHHTNIGITARLPQHTKKKNCAIVTPFKLINADYRLTSGSSFPFSHSS